MPKVSKTVAIAPRTILLTLALIVLLLAIRAVFTLLALAFVAVILAAALEPLVLFMVRHRIPRLVAVLLVFLAALGLLALGVAVAIPAVLQQAAQLARNIPSYMAMAGRLFDELQALPIGRQLALGDTLVPQAVSWASTHFAAWTTQLIGYAEKALEAGVDALIVLLLTLFFMLDAPRLRTSAIQLFPAYLRPTVGAQVTPLAIALGNYVRGQLISMGVLASLLAIGLWLVHEPYAWLIAIVSGVLEIVPWLGGTIGVLLGTLIAMTVSWKVLLLVWVVFAIAHVVQGDLLAPYIQSRVVSLHPAMVLLALLIGGTLYGILGAIIAVPVMATVYVLVERVYVPLMDRQTGPSLALPEQVEPEKPQEPPQD